MIVRVLHCLLCGTPFYCEVGRFEKYCEKHRKSVN